MQQRNFKRLLENLDKAIADGFVLDIVDDNSKTTVPIQELWSHLDQPLRNRM